MFPNSSRSKHFSTPMTAWLATFGWASDACGSIALRSSTGSALATAASMAWCGMVHGRTKRRGVVVEWNVDTSVEGLASNAK